MDKITIKPGYLVSLSVRAAGGVRYDRQDIVKPGEPEVDGTDNVLEDEDKKETAPGVEVAEWKTRRTIEDPEEHKRATKTRSKCRSLISSVCTSTAFGLLCPETREERLDDAIKEARELAAAHNGDERNKRTKVSVFVIKGRIAKTDDEATRAIADEVRSLVDEMRAGILDINAERIRDAAAKAKKMASMLDENAGKKVTAAVERAREVAKDIVKALASKEDAVELVRTAQLDALDEARTMFLTFEENEIKGEPMAATDVRPLNLDDEDVEMKEEDRDETTPDGYSMKAAEL